MIKKYDDADFEAIEIVLKAFLTMLVAKGLVTINDYHNALDEHLNLLFEEIRDKKKELAKLKEGKEKEKEKHD